jgi:hypothetical protein
VATLLKLLPEIVTVEPMLPVAGVKLLIRGGTKNTKPAFEPVPSMVVTLTFPDEPVPTVAVMLVGEFTVNEAAGVPPKLTAVAPVKSVPVMVTVVPADADVGANEETTGAGAIPACAATLRSNNKQQERNSLGRVFIIVNS